MARSVKRLLDLEIDEVSLVDRPANQHGLVAITKNWEAPMGDDELEFEDGQLFDEGGNPVDASDLEPGTRGIFNEDGEEVLIVDPADLAELEATEEHYDPEHDTVGELAGVGKAFRPGAIRRTYQSRGFGQAARLAGRQAGREAGRGAAAVTGGASSLYQAGRANPKRALGIAGGGTAGLGATYGLGRRDGRNGVGKSLGDSVLQELSKAMNEGDRDEVIAKAMDEVQRAQAEAAEARAMAEQLAAEREYGRYVEMAKSYDLPVDPAELAEVLAGASQVLSKRQLDTLDRILASQGELYEELGYSGYQGGSEVMDEVGALALEAVGKSDLSTEQAVVALFESNPAAYDQYLAESR